MGGGGGFAIIFFSKEKKVRGFRIVETNEV